MSEPKTGIQETKELLDALAEIGNGVGQALANDGKITLTDAPALFPALFKLPAAIGGISKVGGELADLDDDEIKLLAEEFAEKFDIPQENAEAMVEDLVKCAVQLYETVSKHFIK